VAAGVVMVFSFAVAGLVGLALQRTVGFRVDEETEISGVDLVTHAESAYELSTIGGGGFRGAPSAVGVPATQKERVDA